MCRLFLIIYFFLASCKIFSQEPAEKYDYQVAPFKEIYLYPKIKDTAAFIKRLNRNCHLEREHRSHYGETINYFKKITIFGSARAYYLLEYDFHTGANVEFPWKKQFIFDEQGKLVKILSEIRLEPVKIFLNEPPFLFGVSSTPHGNGWHEVYKMQPTGLAQIYDGFLGNRPQTYCTGRDNHINIPIELYHRFADINKDGFNDIVFYGRVRYSKIDLGIQAKTIQVTYIFLYNPKTGHFSASEDYSKKYEYIYGNTKYKQHSNQN